MGPAKAMKEPVAGEGGAEDTVSMSSVVTTQSTEEGAGLSCRQALHKAVLEIVYSLSSDVSLKKNSQGLNQLDTPLSLPSPLSLSPSPLSHCLQVKSRMCVGWTIHLVILYIYIYMQHNFLWLWLWSGSECQF